MKKTLKILAVCFGLIILAIIILPYFFKDKIVELVKNRANQQINAQLDFEGVGLTWFTSFPNLSLDIKGLTLINHSPFEGDTLAQIGNFEIVLDVMSVFRGKAIEIVGLEIDQSTIRLVALKDGSTNWDIQKPTETPAAASSEEPSSDMNVALQKYQIRTGHVIYQDLGSNVSFEARDLNHGGRGDFSQERFQLQTDTDIGSLSFTSGGIPFLSNVRTGLKAAFDVNTQQQTFSFLDNELQLNDLLLKFAGTIESADENLTLDVTFSAPNTEFKSILSLLPAIYTKDFADLKASGQLGVQGFVKGTYGEKDFPAFDFKLNVAGGRFQYPDLPKAVSNVQVDLQIRCPGTDADRTVIDLKKLHFELDKDPFDARFVLQTPISDPHISTTLAGRLNLADLKGLIATEPTTEMAGIVSTDLQLQTKLSSLEKREYDKVKASGSIRVDNVAYSAPDLPQKLSVQQATLSFTPDRVMLQDFSTRIGSSDLNAEGSLENVLGFVLTDQTLKGTLTTNSTFFDLNPFLEGPSGELEAVLLPGNIEFTLNSKFQEVQYGRLKLQNTQGVLLLKDRALRLMEMRMNVLNGSVVANGRYSTPENSAPNLFFDLKITGVSIPQTYEHFLPVQMFAPIAKSMQGTFGASLEMVTDLDQTLTPVWSSFNSRGDLNILQASVQDFRPLTVMADALKMDNLKFIALKDLTTAFKIREGKFYLSPVKFRNENVDFLVSGSSGIDQLLDYTLQLNVPAKEVKQQTNNALNQLLNRKVDLLADDSILLNVNLKGSVDKPAVNFAMQDIVKGTTDRAKSLVMQEVQDKKVALEDSVRQELDQQKEELARLKKEAEEKAQQEKDRLKQEAAKKLRKLIKQ